MNKLLSTVKLFSLSTISGILGALGGADNSSKLWRRLCIPLLISSCAYNQTQNLWVILCMSMYIPLSLGYGIPDNTDSGSKLSQFFFKMFKQNKILTGIFTRLVIGLIECLSIILLPIVMNKWKEYLLICLGITLVNIIFGSIIRLKGSFKLFKRTLLLEEFTIYGLITLLILILIIL